MYTKAEEGGKAFLQPVGFKSGERYAAIIEK